MLRLSAHLVDLESSDLLDLLPLLFFAREDFEDALLNLHLPFNTLHILSTRLSFLEDLRLLDIPHLWSVTKPDGLQCALFDSKNSLAVDFENHNTDGKMKLLISILLHLNEKPSTSVCSTRSCCGLFDIESYEFELVALLSGLIYGVPEVNVLSNFVYGYLIHTRSVNYRFLCLVFRNFPSEWMTIWNCMISIIEHVSVDYLELPKNTSSRPALSPEESTIRSIKLNEVVATAGVRLADMKPELMFHRIESVLRWLLIADSTYAGMAVEFCITTQSFPALLMDGIFFLDRKQEGQLLVLLKRLLLDDGAEIRGWISAYLKRQNGADNHIEKLNEYFIKYSAQLIPMDRNEPLTDEVMLRALALLRVIAALRGFANYTFPPVLSSQLLDLLTHKTVQTERGSHYIIYALAFLIGLRSSLSLPSDPNSRNHSSSDTEDRIVSWLQGLIENQDAFEPNNRLAESSVPLSSSKLYFEPLLLLAILFHTNQPGPITDLISNLLGLRIPSLGRTVNSWRKILLQSVFTENMIARHAARVPITRPLSRRLSTHLPIQCILHLLQSHAFAKNRLEIKEWIIGQIYESVCPMHPLLPDLVEAHIVHSFGTTSVSGESAALISECELLSVFSPTGKFAIAQLCTPAADVDQDYTVNWDSPTGQWYSGSTVQPDLTPALLFLYYALFVYDYQLTTRLATSRHCAPGEQPCVYSDQLWERIPITYLLQHARARPTDFGPLYPRLLHLITNHFPHLTVGELMIQDELLLDPFWSPEHFDSSRPDSALRYDLSINDSSGNDCRSSTDISMCCTPAQLNEAFEAALAPVKTLETNNADAALIESQESLTAGRHLIRLISQLYRAVGSSGVDKLLPYGPVLGRQSARLLLVSGSHPLFSVNRRFVQLLECLWCRLYLVMPRRLELLTVNALRESLLHDQGSFDSLIRPKRKLTSLDIRTDPVENLVNGVDPGVFRCPPALRIFLRILESSLLASRSYWTHRLLERVVPLTSNVPTFGSNSTSLSSAMRPASSPSHNGSDSHLESPLTNCLGITAVSASQPSSNRLAVFTDEECERLCANMLLTQNATVVQLLLEYCLPTKQECAIDSEVSVLREIRNILCTYIHYMFIAEPALAEVIVWQTYPRSLLPVSTQAIPSLHICLDNVINVFRLCGDYDKMVFCLDLVSHLSLHYNIQSALERAAFIIDSLFHLLTAVVCVEDRPDLLQACLPGLLRLGGAFPSLAPTISRLLLTVGALIASTLSANARTLLQLSSCLKKEAFSIEWGPESYDLPLADRSIICLQRTLWMFNKLVRRCSAQRNLYYPPELYSF